MYKGKQKPRAKLVRKKLHQWLDEDKEKYTPEQQKIIRKGIDKSHTAGKGPDTQNKLINNINYRIKHDGGEAVRKKKTVSACVSPEKYDLIKRYAKKVDMAIGAYTKVLVDTGLEQQKQIFKELER